MSFNNIVHLKAFLCIKDADVVYTTKSLNTFHDWFSMNFSCSESPKKCMCCRKKTFLYSMLKYFKPKKMKTKERNEINNFLM